MQSPGILPTGPRKGYLTTYLNGTNMTKPDEQETDNTPQNISVNWLEIIKSFELPESIKKNAITAFAKGVGRIITSGIEIPAVYLEGIANKIKATTQAQVSIIQSEGKSASKLFQSDPQLAERALARLGNDIYNQQINREAVVYKTIDELNKTPLSKIGAGKIDPDWLTMFWELSENKSNEELQSYFAKLLTGEIISPGSVSPYTLQILSILTGDIARSFDKLCCLSIDDGEKSFIIHPNVFAFQNIGPLDDFKISYNDLFDLESARLIRSAETIMLNYAETEDAKFEAVDYAGLPANLRLDGHQVHLIQFTRAGRELRNLLAMTPNEEYTRTLKVKLGDDFSL